MQILRNLFVVAVAVAPLALAVPAEARDEPTYGEPTYTCDTMMFPGKTVFGEGNCTATNGALTSGFITTEQTFVVVARTDLQQRIRCHGGGFDRPGGYADTPTSVSGNYCS